MKEPHTCNQGGVAESKKHSMMASTFLFKETLKARKGSLNMKEKYRRASGRGGGGAIDAE